ncbi:haloacid dehalogenase superfamily, subfamily IA, variant 3 with third motif having DD or ED [Algoriphagus locisalis]|uniref:Haloacid dehalogenase superfamily, subfamily IA, variant 3 with third motif having DD or ED n=1 Tax=Algoriphagus locisalis TaxID=305507 RepID=A0A1I7CJY8_9BACT|nr:HAD family phosphatase [Algoriphagus locisalis]SFT99728.1 haloacid dehalogenase superfamily, subfamily IA, variant 3 with third motif having DD or ED [Algoriphagus locisalis]
MLKAVIFDMDGVICHTNPFHSIAFQQFFAKRNLNPTEEEYAAHMYGKNNGYILSHFLGRKIEGEELTILEDEKEGLFREIYKSEVNPIAGFMEFFAKLKSEGVLTAVATSAPRANLDLIIGTLGISAQMQSQLAAEDVAKHKPDPEVYLKSAAKLGVKPEECLVFEDSFSGASAGINAGMKVVGVLSSHTKDELPNCDFYIKDYKGLELNSLIPLFK